MKITVVIVTLKWGEKKNGEEVRGGHISPSLGHCLLANILFETLAETGKLLLLLHSGF